MKQSLRETHPALALQWSEKNTLLSPGQVTYGSHKRVWWHGTCGHEWEAPVKARVYGENCPYCAGKRILVGFNDLETIAPELAAEWSDRNEGTSPKEVTAGSHRKVWWKGSCGHEWQASVKNRVNGAGCPYCSSRQVQKGENDLATVHPSLAKEWSEKNHPLRPEDVAPFSNRKAWWTCRKCGQEWETRIATRSAGSTCPYCSGLRLKPGVNDLATTHPKLAAEWSKRNEPINAKQVHARSRQNVWWLCRTCGYEWKAVIASRVQGSGCPVCQGRIVRKGYNDLETTDPDLCREWDEKRNVDLFPSMVHRHSRRVVWWKGSCCHTWRAGIMDRAVDGQGCPQCEQEFRQVLPFLLVLYYAWLQGVKVVMGDRKRIGLTLDFYFPEFCGAILLSENRSRSKEEAGQEAVKEYLCSRRKIRLIRILRKGEAKSGQCRCVRLKDERMESWGEAIQKALHLLGIHVDVQPDRDRGILLECYRRWKEQMSIGK